MLVFQVGLMVELMLPEQNTPSKTCVVRPQVHISDSPITDPVETDEETERPIQITDADKLPAVRRRMFVPIRTRSCQLQSCIRAS